MPFDKPRVVTPGGRVGYRPPPVPPVAPPAPAPDQQMAAKFNYQRMLMELEAKIRQQQAVWQMEQQGQRYDMGMERAMSASRLSPPGSLQALIDPTAGLEAREAWERLRTLR